MYDKHTLSPPHRQGSIVFKGGGGQTDSNNLDKQKDPNPNIPITSKLFSCLNSYFHFDFLHLPKNGGEGGLRHNSIFI